ncbi:MAG: hypothetical protein KBF79_14665, partial [Saprospiraceae bacterium]|nr:hypothetical protein [Saprospiraceae bacterium]
KKQTMGIRTEQSELDVTLNLMFELAALTMNKWTENTAYIIQQSLLNPNIGQKELEQKLNLLQSSISRGLKRGGYDEIQKLNTYYKKTINNL